MGVWGTGLYSGDFAKDLRATVAAVVRLPFNPDRLVDILCEGESAAANNSSNEEHTTFWLVVADQFTKRGIVCDRVRNHALGIIDRGEDIVALGKLGMKTIDLNKRRKMLDELRARVVAAPANRKLRNRLKKPQPLLMEVGDVMLYPTCLGDNINPYFASKELNTVTRKDGPIPWTSVPWAQDGWGAMVVVDCGRAFDFLSWYRAVRIAEARREKPSLDSLRGEVLWILGWPGTCSASHFKKMELEKVGTLPVSLERLKQVFPDVRRGISAAVKDISIANSMSAAPSVPRSSIPKPLEAQKGLSSVLNYIVGTAPTMLGIEKILQ